MPRSRSRELKCTVQFREAFEALGYVQAKAYRTWGTADRWYLRQGDHPDVVQAAYFSHKPSGVYAVALGVLNPEASRRVTASFLQVMSYMHPIWHSDPNGFAHHPCWTLFDTGQMFNWTSFSIPDGANPEDWPARFAQIVDVLERRFWPIDSVEGVLELLLSKTHKADWRSGNAIWRLAQIVALAKIAGVDGRYVRERIKPYELYIRRDQHGAAIDPNLVVDHFWAYL